MSVGQLPGWSLLNLLQGLRVVWLAASQVNIMDAPLNESYTLTEEQEAAYKIDGELLKLAAEIKAQLQGRSAELNATDQLLIGQFDKARRTVLAILTLVREGLRKMPLCLLRALVENTINLKYAIRSDPIKIARRYWDWATLDSVRRARASNWFHGTPLYSPEPEECFSGSRG